MWFQVNVILNVNVISINVIQVNVISINVIQVNVISINVIQVNVILNVKNTLDIFFIEDNSTNGDVLIVVG